MKKVIKLRNTRSTRHQMERCWNKGKRSNKWYFVEYDGRLQRVRFGDWV